MSQTDHDLTHLISLLEAALAEARRLRLVDVADALEDAAGRARGAMARDGRPDEGLAPEDLTTGNDK